MLELVKTTTIEVGASFAEEAGDYLGTPRHPALGLGMFMLAGFALGNLLCELWRSVGAVVA